MVLMLSMDTSIDASMAVISTSKGSAVSRWILTVFCPPVGVSNGVVSLGHLCPNICPGVYHLLCLFLLH